MGRPDYDERYRRAVDVVAANCPGLPARDLLAADPARFPPAKVRSLANTSPEYQRHVVGRAAAGDAKPFRLIAATLLVYDTVAFHEVVSRLHRAAGLVRREADLIGAAVRAGSPPDRLADRLLALDLMADQAGRLRTLLAAVEPVDGPLPRTVRIPASVPTPGHPDPTPKLYAAGGLGLVAKNVRNLPALRPEHRPTAAEHRQAVALTNGVEETAAAARDAGRGRSAGRTMPSGSGPAGRQRGGSSPTPARTGT